ncbi:MAG: T9SS type A sorting domain-containing protein [Bacteroidales bacterium]|nr:T9SS type A sorting domain-containing protein [Bacteroidales bacterium]
MRRILHLCIFCMLLLVPLSVAAQFSSGDIITIASGTNYLSTDVKDNVANVTGTPTLYSLWEVTVSGSNYTLKNVATGKYLGYSTGTLGAPNGLTISTSSANFSYDATSFFVPYSNFLGNRGRYLSYNNGWSLNTSGTNTTELTWTKGTNTTINYNSVLNINPATQNAASGTSILSPSLTANTIVTDTYTNGSTVINGSSTTTTAVVPSYTVSYASNDSWATVNNSNNTVAAPALTGSSRSTTITATFAVGGNNVTTATATFTQTGTVTHNFSHKAGASGRPMMANGMQGVHTYKTIVYIPDGGSKTLELQERTFPSYSRWYDYNTDLASDNLATPTGYTHHTAGEFKLSASNSTSRNNDAQNATFTMNGASHKMIACDLSAYEDFTPAPTNNNIDFNINTIATFVEPTLSYRAIFDIRPATEMSAVMANCTGSTFYETHNIIAPAGKSINLGLNYPRNNYYDGNGNSLANSTNWNTSRGSFVSGNEKYINTTITAPGDYTVDVTCNGYNIARFNVHVVNASEVISPDNDTVVNGNTTQVLSRIYNLAAYQDFNSYDGTQPISWDECSYGFAKYNGVARNTYKNSNGVTGTTVANTTNSKYAQYGEYALLTYSAGWDPGRAPVRALDNSTFLYADGAAQPSILANLVIDGELCNGSKLLVSARVAANNPSRYGAAPNLNFVITGIDADGTETAITTFTTGDVTQGGHWYQYMFEIQKDANDNTDYNEYRLQIVNNCANNSGNDFCIDDIKFWKGKKAVLPYQGQVSCDASSNKITSVLRVNYNNTLSTGTKYYYQWRDNSRIIPGIGIGQTLDLDYLNKRTPKDGSIYGVLETQYFIDRTTTTLTNGVVANPQEGMLWTSLSDMINAGESYCKTNNTDRFYGYLEEVINENQTVYILYILHVSDKFVRGREYAVELTERTQDISPLDSETIPSFGQASSGDCGFQGSIVVTIPQALSVNNTITYENELGSLCAQAVHSLQPAITINVTDDEDNSIKQVDGTCIGDWVLFSYNNIPTNYNFTTRELHDAMIHFRTAYPNATSLNNVVALGVFTAQDLSILQTIAADGLLVLSENIHYEYLTAGESKTVTLFPINGTVVDMEGNPITEGICLSTTELTITARTQPTGFLKLGDINLNYTDDAADNRVAATRIGVNDATARMQIRELDNVQVTGLRLIPEFTTDPSVTTEVAIPYSNLSTLKQGDYININVNALGTLQEGYEYAVAVDFNRLNSDGTLAEGECTVGMNYFLVKVVPAYAVWTPMSSTNAAWNNDNNWSVATVKGEIVRNGFVPKDFTNVIIPSNATVYPVLPTASGMVDEPGATPYINYDFNYDITTVDQIFFAANAMMGNQQSLKYNEAYVDMTVPSSRWTLVGMPMQSMYSGDFNVPTSEMDNHDPFVVTNYDGNYNVQFWQNLYNNTTAYNVGWSGVNNAVNVTVGANNWTSNFNGVKQEYNPGAAASVWGYDTRKGETEDYDLIVTLPGKETTLYYYSYGNPTGIGESTPRPNGGQLAFPMTSDYEINSVAGDDYIVFGNPTMAYIDLEKMIAHNAEIADEYSYWVASSANTLDWTQYTIVNGQGNVSSMPSEIVAGYLAPMRAVMLKKTDATATSVNISLLPSDLTTTPVAKDMAMGAQLYIKAKCEGHKSYANISENAMATENYNANEDAKMMIANSDYTPSAIYTVGGNNALNVNTLNTINNVPVAVYANKTTTAKLSFEGADNFNGQLYLYDAVENNSTLIDNNNEITITTTKQGEAIRYFIQKVVDTNTDIDITTTTEGINIFVQPDGSIAVSSNDMLLEINVYNGAGQRIIHQDANSQFVGISLPAGVYAVQAVTENNNFTQKVVIK